MCSSNITWEETQKLVVNASSPSTKLLDDETILAHSMGILHMPSMVFLLRYSKWVGRFSGSGELCVKQPRTFNQVLSVSWSNSEWPKPGGFFPDLQLHLRTLKALHAIPGNPGFPEQSFVRMWCPSPVLHGFSAEQRRFWWGTGPVDVGKDSHTLKSTCNEDWYIGDGMSLNLRIGITSAFRTPESTRAKWKWKGWLWTRRWW